VLARLTQSAPELRVMWRGPGRDPALPKSWPVGDVRNTASREHGGQGLAAGRAGRVLAAQPARPETQGGSAAAPDEPMVLQTVTAQQLSVA
jgi:hypothetical protein